MSGLVYSEFLVDSHLRGRYGREVLSIDPMAGQSRFLRRREEARERAALAQKTKDVTEPVIKDASGSFSLLKSISNVFKSLAGRVKAFGESLSSISSVAQRVFSSFSKQTTH
jgi:hypothetical protein